MRKLLFILPVFAVMACGDDETTTVEDEPIVLDSKEQKLSYLLGSGEADGLMKAPFSANIDKEKVIEGFTSSYGEANPPATCEQSLTQLFGPQGTDYNLAYAEEGCLCMGKLMASQLYRQLNEFGKAKEIDTKSLNRGFKDRLMGTGESPIDDAEKEQIMAEFDADIKAQMTIKQKAYEEQMAITFGENKTTGENFLAMNGKKAGVKTTASGLQYKVLTPGSGPMPKLGDQVQVHYTGTLLDGTKFDSSHDRGQPYGLSLPAQVIQGWNEVLLLMPKGSKLEVYVPQELAYGANPPQGSGIEPYMAIMFTMEMVNVSSTPTATY